MTRIEWPEGLGRRKSSTRAPACPPPLHLPVCGCFRPLCKNGRGRIKCNRYKEVVVECASKNRKKVPLEPDQLSNQRRRTPKTYKNDPMLEAILLEAIFKDVAPTLFGALSRQVQVPFGRRSRIFSIPWALASRSKYRNL